MARTQKQQAEDMAKAIQGTTGEPSPILVKLMLKELEEAEARARAELESKA